MTEVIGVVPAAGRADRLGKLPCSKELLPLLRFGGSRVGGGPEPDPDPVCYGLLRALSRAGIDRAYITIRSGKWDVPGHLRRGEEVGLAISYLVLEDSPSPAHSVDAAFPFVGDSVVALGFPDVLLQVEDPFGAMLERWRVSESDVVLGLFPPAPDYPTERVDVDANGRILSLDPRAEGEDQHRLGRVARRRGEDQRPTWTLAVWGPDFGRYLHDAVGAWNRQETEAIAAAAGGARASVTAPDELVLGRVFRAALQDGIGIDGVLVSEEPFVDIGDPDRLIGALRRAYGK